MTKKIFSFLLICLMLLSTTALAFADTEETDPYKAILERYNALYDIDLVYEYVNPEQISIEEYEEIVKGIAVNERETLNYIESRENDVYVPHFELPGISTNSITTKKVTRTKEAYSIGGEESPLNKTAYEVTYTYYTKYDPSHSPTKWVVKKTDEKPIIEVKKSVGSKNSFSNKSFSTKYLDNQKTIGVTTKGTLTMTTTNVGVLKFPNVTVYAEFSY